ncbi:MAG: hypothetical protein KZQ83_20880 [gamma proteobacterium symbiont of Taylorina sp.]|nr:hypothetical protein [gamma proteobacterium symbiont of Taylorina sp.]
MKGNIKTNMKRSIIFTIFVFLITSASAYAEDIVPADYCYKPEKPLLLSTSNHKKRYDEDMKEYEKCKKSFTEMYERVSEMQKKSQETTINMNKEYIKAQ